MTTTKKEGELMRYYIGIDPSLTGCAVVVIDEEGKLIVSQRLENKLRGVERLIYIRDKVLRIISCYDGIQGIGIEGYARGASNRREEAGELGGILRVMFYEFQLPWLDIAPSQIKKFATGNGNAPKDHVLLAVYKKWGVEFETNDEADAFVAAQIVRAMEISEYEELLKYEIEVLGKLRKGA